MAKRRKKTEKKKLKEKLDKIVKKYAKLRDNYTCQKCGKKVEGSNCHGSHIIPVSADGRLAFDDQNLKAMCYHCHINWWHKNPVESGKWIVEKFPDRVKELKEKHKANYKLGSISEDWYREKIEYYKEKTRDFLDDGGVNITIDDLKYLTKFYAKEQSFCDGGLTHPTSQRKSN